MRDWTRDITAHLARRGVDHTRHRSAIEELAQHLGDRYEALVERGMSGADAERVVLQELAENDDIARELRVAERAQPPATPAPGGPPGSRVEACWQDLRYAARAVRKSPGFAAVVVVTLALGIGANTAIFSVVNAVMLRPLPYPHAEGLVRIWESNPPKGWPQFAASQPNFLDWRAQSRSWAALAAVGAASFTLTASDGAQLVRGSAVTADFLTALGVMPAIGRNFTADEDRPGGNTQVAIVTDGFWRRSLGGDPAAPGRTLSLNGSTYTVVGVLPPTFEWGTADLLVPLAPDAAQPRGDHRLSVIGRLKDGVTMQQAANELTSIAAALATQYPASNEGWTVRLATFYDWLIPVNIRTSLTVLLAAVGVVLLIACGNVANLLLARSAVRQKEIAVRLALGASRSRITRQLFFESLLLAAAAAVIGVLVTLATTRLVVRYGPTTLPRLDEVSVDPWVLGFAMLSALVAAVLFGVVPAIHASGHRPGEALQDASRGSTGGRARQRLRSTLTVVEVALSVALLIGAGLLLRSFGRLQQVDPGFEIGSSMTMRVSLPRGTYDTNEKMGAFYTRLLNETRTLPGMLGVATSNGVPLTAGSTATELRLPGTAPAAGAQQSGDWRLVSPGYFDTMAIRLRGRDFTERDGPDSPTVTIVSEALARMHWPNQDPIGKQIVIQSFGGNTYTVIGVAGDVHSAGLDTDPRPVVYASTTSFSGWNPMSVVWRSSADPASHVSAIRDVVRRIDPSVPLYDIRSLDSLLADSFGARRFNMYLLACFAAIALALAATGLFGVMAYLVSQRTREIGVRLALGAERGDIFKLILGRGLALAGIGAVLGVAGAWWLTQAMQSLLFAVSATDPATFVAVPLILVLVAALACYIPARRAMQVDPVGALRAE
jgi:putative ABC transport system permease protein